MKDDLLHALNPQQRAAVTAPTGAALVLAGPGSGKTRVLTHRIAYLIDELGALPSSILAMTFTNRAARVMRSRLEELLEIPPGGNLAVSLGTFHSFCARLLRMHADRMPFDRSFVIFDDSDQRSLMRSIVKELELEPKRFSPARLLDVVSAAKNEMRDADQYAASTYDQEETRRVYKAVHQRYQAQLASSNALDYDDLLLNAVNLLSENPDLRQNYRQVYRHLLVDEFQDTNTVQYALLKLLCGSEGDIFVVGDIDQSIYRWRGADYRNVGRFLQDYPAAQTYRLEQNYRSTQVILDAAMGVIDRIPGRPPLKLFTERQGGEKVELHEAYDEVEEATYVVSAITQLTADGAIERGDCAVMYRTNAQSRALEEAFIRAGMPYRLLGAQRFYGRAEVKDLVAYLRLIHNPRDEVSMRRVLNTPRRGLGGKAQEALEQAAQQGGVPVFEVLVDLADVGGSIFADQFSGRALSAMRDFGELLAGWIAEREELSVAGLIDRVLKDIGYQDYLTDGTEEGEDRWLNVLELRNVADERADPNLSDFLEHVALVSDQDTLSSAADAPVLLTLHAAKGLEFKVVLIIGVDEGVLPHQRSMDDPESMYEERRLFYVGMTRAMDRLLVTRASRRRMMGPIVPVNPSRFLSDIPRATISGVTTRRATPAETIFARVTSWEKSSPEPVEARYKAGMRVRHATFGEGQVIDTFIDRHGEEVSVHFESKGTLRLDASVAKLEIL